MTDDELVVLRTAARSTSDGGEDILAVQRRHLRGLRTAGTKLYVDAEATHMVTLGASFARRVVKQFSEALSESSSLPHPLIPTKEPTMSFVDSKHDRFSREARADVQGAPL